MTPINTARDNERIKARLEKLLNRLPGLVYRCRIVADYQYVLEYASKGSMDLLGVPAEELVEAGVNIIERMTHPADLERLRKVFGLIMKAAQTDANVIIYGETGSGKDVVARAIHNCSGRRGAYVPVNCGAIPENLLESEFFGHARGAFTGAVSAKDGYVAAADNGTLFLDEIGELPQNLQVKFLRVLETRSFTPLGSNTQKISRFRLVAATNRDLAALVREKKTRADFYYRINVLAITLPPLRERKADIPLLIHAWEERNGINLSLPHSVRILMNRYQWPGNVRELHNFLDRYAAFGPSVAECLGAADSPIPPVDERLSLAEALRQVEHSYILKALDKACWRRGRAAEILGLNLRTLQRRMKALGINDRGESY